MRTAAGIGVATVVVLATDALWHTPVGCDVLGVVAALVLFALTARLPRQRRHQVWVCVAVATLVELFGSVLWGVYHYRLGGIPAYVPFGHGLIYLAGLEIAASSFMQRWRSALIRSAAIIATVWSIAGLTLIPMLGGRRDILGAFFLVYFLVFLRRQSRAPFFAAMFFLTSLLEICGTALHDWTWAVSAPGLAIPVGNPPSVIAGAYCCLDAMVIVVSRQLASRSAGSDPSWGDAANIAA